jgi:outer membrane scaffolding protein for murein synthesis (MipA/OmpV family)
VRKAAGALAALLAMLSGVPAHAESRPEWEFGLGVTGFSFPDYRGSDEQRGYLLPFPYVIYRGDVLRVDRQGVRGVFFETDRVEFDISISGTPPVDSSKNRAREGMPDLDPTFEIGPRLNVVLARNADRSKAFSFRLPVRAVIATDLSYAQGQGVTAYPNLTYDSRPHLFDGRWRLGLQAGLLYATKHYHEYFYGVAEEFATPERPSFAAKGGYSGAALAASLTRRFRKIWVGAFARYESLKGVAFESSPLMRRDYAFTAGIAVAYVFAESENKVEVDVED